MDTKVGNLLKNPARIFLILKKLKLADLLPDERYLKWKYLECLGRKPDLESPQLFSEKMQWLKIHDRKPSYNVMVDKYAVKEYVRSKMGDDAIIPTIGVWTHFDEIEFDSLPRQFVLKCTHDSGGTVICTDKAMLDMDGAKNRIEKCLKHNYFKNSREWVYKDVKPRILAEEYMENSSEGLHDYKIWCFNGEPRYVQYISGRLESVTKEAFFDLEWNRQGFTYHNPPLDYDVPKPKRLDEMLAFAKEFSRGIPFLRVDLYVLEDDSIRFGELTFYPMSGLDRFHPDEMDLKFGQMIDISPVEETL